MDFVRKDDKARNGAARVYAGGWVGTKEKAKRTQHKLTSKEARRKASKGPSGGFRDFKKVGGEGRCPLVPSAPSFMH